VDLAVLGGAGGVAVAAGLLAVVAGTAEGLLGLVSGVLVVAADDAEELADRHLHDLGLVGAEGLSSDIGGEGEDRQGGEGLGEHCDGWLVG